MSASIWIVNIAILAAVLWADLGTKEITWHRILRPVIVAAIAVAIFVKSPQTSGNGLELELGGAVAGLLLGALGSFAFMRITRRMRAEHPISRAGLAYAVFWIVVIGARLLFTYGANHWYNHSLGTWLYTNRITVDGLTDALILLAIGMVAARVVRFVRATLATPRAPRSALLH